MFNGYNPFVENRAEQMRDLWKYYVPFPGIEVSGKPLVVQGGRGSGKTMFFLCNSWRQVLSKIKKNGKPSLELLSDDSFIGIYYRVDTSFVSSMCMREEEHWEPIFQTYLGICILQEILDLIIELNKDMPMCESELAIFIRQYSQRLNPSSMVDTLVSFRNETNSYLDVIEDKINGSQRKALVDLRWINAHRLISDVCLSCNSLLSKELIFRVFIDEYETLQPYQQKIVNTLIKHSTQPVIFNIGMRPEGMKTKETISQTEIIESPHDYALLQLSVEPDAYLSLLRRICEKRIRLGKEQNKIPPEASEDIEFYLGLYSVDEEIARIERASASFSVRDKLKELIDTCIIKEKLTETQAKEYKACLCDDAPLINARLHYALLCQKTTYTPTLVDLYDAYTNNSRRYTDWMHNRKNGLVFLLCKEHKREKMYYGFDAFAILSSNVVRFFLELCEQAFRIAFLDDYQWDEPLSPEIQTEAARYVGSYKIMDISSYEPYGRELRIFVQYLGQIFYRLHTDENSTVGEPEPNHFSTKDLSLNPHTRELLSSAIMWNVLQAGEPTKKKSSMLSPETVDYYLNKIYAPHFGISYRNQRKIQISEEILDHLLSGNDTMAKAGFREFFKSEYFVADGGSTQSQLTLFDVDGEA